MIDRQKAENAIKDLLDAMGINPKRHDDIEETPTRVAKMLEEVWRGEQYTNKDIANMFGKCFPSDSKGMVIVKRIQCFSYCEHHLALMYNLTVDIGYIPHGRVIGLSKMPRIADMVCRRLQLQEKIGKDIVETMNYIVGEDVIVRVTGEHSCLTARGIKKPNSQTVSMEMSGVFNHDIEKRKEFLELLKN